MREIHSAAAAAAAKASLMSADDALYITDNSTMLPFANNNEGNNIDRQSRIHHRHH